MVARNFLYAPYYCEENIWHLCRRSEFLERKPHVAIITNDLKCCPLWHQRAAARPHEPVWWDYHVVMFCLAENGWQVWDLDTRLGLPVPAADYIHNTFELMPVHPMHSPLFRVMDAMVFVEAFSSDRSHMKDPDGKWLHPPPHWQPILKEQGSTLVSLLDVSIGSPGSVHDLESFKELLGIS